MYKPAPGPCGLREVSFYKNVFGSYFEAFPNEMKVLKAMVPNYYGTQYVVNRAGESRILSLIAVIIYLSFIIVAPSTMLSMLSTIQCYCGTIEEVPWHRYPLYLPWV